MAKIISQKMLFKNYFFYFFACSSVFSSCSRSASQDVPGNDYEVFSRSALKEFPLKAPTKGQEPKVTNTQIFQRNINLIGVADTFLFATDFRSPKILTVLNTNTGKLLINAISRGRRSGEGMSAVQVLNTSIPHVVWLFDGTGQKLLKIDLKQALSNFDYSPKELLIPKDLGFARSLTLVNDSTFAACSFYNDSARFFIFNKDGIQSRIGYLPNPVKGWEKNIKSSNHSIYSRIFKADLAKNPLTNQFVLAYNKISRVEIYKGDTLMKAVNGPDYFLPKFKLKNGKEGFVHVVGDGEVKISYESVYCNAKHIYLFYKGGDKNIQGFNKIFVLDWDGNFVKYWKLKNSIYAPNFYNQRGRTLFYSQEVLTQKIINVDVTI